MHWFDEDLGWEAKVKIIWTSQLKFLDVRTYQGLWFLPIRKRKGFQKQWDFTDSISNEYSGLTRLKVGGVFRGYPANWHAAVTAWHQQKIKRAESPACWKAKRKTPFTDASKGEGLTPLLSRLPVLAGISPWKMHRRFRSTEGKMLYLERRQFAMIGTEYWSIWPKYFIVRYLLILSTFF